MITSVLNGMPHLDRMLESVPIDGSVEHIAIDAGSTDGSRERLREVSGLQLVERPGLSLYGAWNEGVAAARGRYIWFVNADDVLPPEAMARALAAVAAHGDADIIAGSAKAFVDNASDEGEAIQYFRGAALAGCVPRFLTFGAPLINAKLIRRDLINSCGGFDTSYAFAADRAFLLGLVLNARRTVWHGLDGWLYRYRIHGDSLTLKPSAARRIELSEEHQRIARQYLADPALDRATSELMRAWLSHEQAVTVVYGVATHSWRRVMRCGMAFLRAAPSTISALLFALRIRSEYRRALRIAAVDAEPMRRGVAA